MVWLAQPASSAITEVYHAKENMSYPFGHCPFWRNHTCYGLGFHGGTIQDIQNRIKQALETAKQSEVYEEYKAMTENYKQIYAAFNGLNRSASSLWGNVEDSIIKNPLSALLGRDGNLKQVLQERTQFDLLHDGGNIGPVRRDNIDRLKNIHQQEFQNGVDAAQNVADLSNAIEDHTDELIQSLRNGDGSLATYQKIALLSADEVTIQNANNAVLTQETMSDWSREALQGNLKTEEGLYQKEQDFYLPDADSPLFQQEVKDARLKELPK